MIVYPMNMQKKLEVETNLFKIFSSFTINSAIAIYLC